MKRRCSNCTAYSRTGECRRKPPAGMMLNDEFIARWPLIGDPKKDFCVEGFEPVEPVKEVTLEEPEVEESAVDFDVSEDPAGDPIQTFVPPVKEEPTGEVPGAQ